MKRGDAWILAVVGLVSCIFVAACGSREQMVDQISSSSDLQALIRAETRAWDDSIADHPKMVETSGFDRDEYYHLASFLMLISGIKEVPETIVTVPDQADVDEWLPPPTVDSFRADAEHQLGTHWDHLLLFPGSVAAAGGPDPSKLMRAQWVLQQNITVKGTPALRLLLRTFKAIESQAPATSVVVMRAFRITLFANDARVPELDWTAKTYGVDTCGLLVDGSIRAAPPAEQATAASELHAELLKAPTAITDDDSRNSPWPCK